VGKRACLLCLCCVYLVVAAVMLCINEFEGLEFTLDEGGQGHEDRWVR
jgi:hypothetical protein